LRISVSVFGSFIGSLGLSIISRQSGEEKNMARGTARRGRGRGGRGGGRGRGGAAAAAVAAAAVSSVTQVPNGEAEIEQSRVVGEVEVSSQSDLVVESEVAVGTAASTDFQPVVETVTTLGIDTTTTTTTTDVETRKFGKDMITHDGGGNDDASGILVEAAECSSSQEKNESQSSGADLVRLNEATPAPPGVLEEEATKTLLVSAEVEEKMEYLNNNNNGMEGKALNLNSSTVVAFEDVFVLGNQERVDAVIIATEEEEEEELVSDFHEVQQGIQQQQQQQIATNCGEEGILPGVSMDLDPVVVGGPETFSVEEELVADVAAAVATEEVSNVPVTQMADDTANSEVIIAVPNEAGNMEEVELEAEEEKKNHELDESSIPASSKIEGALEQPLEQPLGQPDKEFVGGVADLIGENMMTIFCWMWSA
jgi:hypothetical protein